MANVTTSIRMDADTKKAAAELLNDLGFVGSYEGSKGN